MKRVCVFCGSSSGKSPAYRRLAEELGTSLAKANLEVVYGGGRAGLMGALADAALAAGGRVIGVIPEALAERELQHGGLSEGHVVPDMHSRKALMAKLADAFVALPGGFGTLDELFEILTWAQLGFHRKPVGLLEVEGFFGPLLEFLRKLVSEGFVSPENLRYVQLYHSPAALLETLRVHPIS